MIMLSIWRKIQKLTIGEVRLPRDVIKHIMNTHSIFWRIYEYASALLLFIFFLMSAVFVWNSFASVYNLPIFYKDLSIYLFNLFISAISFIFVGDLLKFAITRSPKDNPFRKWFSFKWAQKYKPAEIVIIPEGYKGQRESLLQTKCPKCGVVHAFAPDEKKTRKCTLNHCGESVEAPRHAEIDTDSNVVENRLSEKKSLSSEKEGVCAPLSTDRPPKDIIDEIRPALLRFILKHSWMFAEYSFKLTAWMVGASAMAAFGSKPEILEVHGHTFYGVGIFLAVTWVVALTATLLRLTGTLQDMAIENFIFKKKHHPIVSIFIGCLITGLIVLPMINLFFILVKMFVQIFQRGGVI